MKNIRGEELSIEINIDVPVAAPDAVCFETGASRAQAADPALFVYEHHGEGFGWSDPGALTCLFDDMVSGRELPRKFVSKSLADVDTLTALALTCDPTLVTIPAALNFVSNVDFAHRRGAAGMAQLDPEVENFLHFLRVLFPKKASKAKFDECLNLSFQYIADYIANDRLPAMPDPGGWTTMLDKGSRGFIIAESRDNAPLALGWPSLFRTGFLRGVIFGKDFNGRRQVLGARKGPFVDFKLDLAARLLNEMERAAGELPDWKSDALWLYGPADGTTLLVSHIIAVLVRV